MNLFDFDMKMKMEKRLLVQLPAEMDATITTIAEKIHGTKNAVIRAAVFEYMKQFPAVKKVV